MKKAVIFVVAGVLISTVAFARIEVREESSATHPDFFGDVQRGLNEIKASDHPVIKKLYNTLLRATAKVEIAPVTGDPKSIHSSGSKTRWHTQRADGLSKQLGRSMPADAVIFVPAEKLAKGNVTDVLVHELMHAFDLVTGRYNPSGEIRERRAVFMQNLWRDLEGRKLRRDYHGRFKTFDYHAAKSKNEVLVVADRILTSDKI